MEVTCDNDNHVAYLFEQFNTVTSEDYFTLTANNVQILRKLMLKKYKLQQNYFQKSLAQQDWMMKNTTSTILHGFTITGSNTIIITMINGITQRIPITDITIINGVVVAYNF